MPLGFPQLTRLNSYNVDFEVNKVKALDILYELAGVRSDTGSAYEKALGEKIYDMISENSYFKANPALCGMETFGDFMDRPVVWALRPGKSKKTVLLSGHYDAVEIDSYGPFKDVATQPDLLKERMQQAHLENDGVKDESFFKDLYDDNWIFGRGCADMKGGLSAALEIVLGEECFENTILFVAVYDEENLSAGMRCAMPLIRRLRDEYDLDFRLCLIGEPQDNDPEGSDHVNMYGGGAGKVLPLILARGCLSHSAQALEGLNAAYMISEVVREIEMNADYISTDYGISVQPPTVLWQRDLKPAYDVSLVEYAAAAISILFLESVSPDALMERVEASCKKAMKKAAKKYRKSFEKARELGAVRTEVFKDFRPKVMRLEEVLAIVKEREPDFEKRQQAFNDSLSKKIRGNEMTLIQASVSYMQDLTERSGIKDPVVVIGIAPPYYPAVTSFRLKGGIGKLEQLYEKAAGENGYTGSVEPYFAGMGDISYMMCADAQAQRRLMSNLTLPESIYDIPFEDIQELSMPSFWMGPRSKAMHQWKERVYKPDIEELLPAMMRSLIRNI